MHDPVKYQKNLDWLMEEENPSVNYFAMLWLKGKSEFDPGIKMVRAKINNTKIVQTLLAGQTKEGYWGDTSGYLDHRFAGTAWRILMLLELGLDSENIQVQKAVKFLIQAAYNEELNGFVSRQNHPEIAPCYTGDLLWIFLQCGYAGHEYVQNSIKWLHTNMILHDGEDRQKAPGCLGRHACIRGVFPVIRALFALHSSYITEETSDILNRCVEFILKHRIYKKSHDASKPLNIKMTQLTFPNFYYPDFLYGLFLLLQAGVHDSRMKDAISALKKKQNKNGRWKMQRLYNERSKHDLFASVINIEQRGEDSK